MIEINGKVYRNLQEQVGENLEDIEDLQDDITTINGKLDNIPNQVYSKTETDNLLSAKSDKASTYNKTETDALLNTKQNTLVSGTNIKTINNNSILGEGNLNLVINTNVIIIDAEDTTIDLARLYDLVETNKCNVMVREDFDGDGTVFNYYYLESTLTNSNKTRFAFNFYSTFLNAQGNIATIIKWQVNNYTDVNTATWEDQVVLDLSSGGGGGTTKYLHKITLTNTTYGSVNLDVLLNNNTPITTWELIESNLSSGVNYPAYGSAVVNNEPYVYNHAEFNFTTNEVTLTFIGYWAVPGSGTVWKQLNSDWSSSQITISDIVE